MRLIITDLDGTLLDRETYGYGDARPALEYIRQSGIPLVFCTSKTRAEVEVWRSTLHNKHPFIPENGGAVFTPAEYFPFPIPSSCRVDHYDVVRLGTQHGSLVAALRTAAQQSDCRVRGMQDMTAEEVVEAAGLKPEEVALARQREYDEPFLIHDEGRRETLLHAIERLGFRWTRGDRFHHIMGDNDKAKAVEILVGLYRRVATELVTIGLGDGPNDAPFLRYVDIPILIPSLFTSQLKEAVPQGRIARFAGARGWNEAVLEVLGAKGESS